MTHPVAIMAIVPNPYSSAPLAELVLHEHPVGLGEAHLHGPPGVLDGAHRAGARAAVVARDLDDVRVGLGDAAGDGADARLGHELDADLGRGVDLVQVIDQLGQVLDAVDIVVRRGRDERDTGLGPAQAGDVRGHLLARELPPLAGLGALGDLDLELVGVHEELRGDAEAARGDLLARELP